MEIKTVLQHVTPILDCGRKPPISLALAAPPGAHAPARRKTGHCYAKHCCFRELRVCLLRRAPVSDEVQAHVPRAVLRSCCATQSAHAAAQWHEHTPAKKHRTLKHDTKHAGALQRSKAHT